MKLNKELEKLKSIFQSHNTSEFKKQVEILKHNFTSENEIKKMDEFIDAMVNEEMEERCRAFEEIKLQAELILNKEIIPFSYIAENYFKKSKAWLYHRLNGNNINGKPVHFTPEEIKTFNFALQDISKKLGSISIV
jgi:hypothetical protein